MAGVVVRRCRRHGLVRGACAECEAEAKRRRSANNVRLGRNSAHWRRTSASRLRLAEYECEIGRPGCTGEATTVDLIGVGDHSRARLEDTRAACRHCHGAVDGGRW